jgi:hypothetical protein
MVPLTPVGPGPRSWHFINSSFAVLHISQAFILISFKDKSTFPKLMVLQINHCNRLQINVDDFASSHNMQA